MRAKEFAKHIFEQVKSNWCIPVTEHQVYSTAEQKVGVWTDGKPIYRKTVSCGALPNTSIKEVSHGINNIAYIVAINGTAFRSSDGRAFNLPHAVTNSLTYAIQLTANTTKIFIETGSDRSGVNMSYVTLYYTKTTDTVTSPKVPYEPLHEWSTEEKLVGYWIDGKAVYEKTITGTSPADRGEINTGISNVSNAVITQMRITNTAGYNANFAYSTVSADIKADGSKIWFEYSSDNFKSRPFTATIQYTKTT